MKARSLAYLLVLSGCLAALSCSGAADDISIQGAGATFPAPLYKRWFMEYYRLHPNVRVNYQPIGSPAGTRQFIEGLVQFAASDAAMTDDEMAEVAGGVQLLPMTAGSVVVSYHLPGQLLGLQLSRDALARIALGEITSWDDPAITATNPQLTLPPLPITFVRRAEGSGTTFAFTKHLSAINSTWREGPGTGTSVAWPVGVGAKGNNGVAAVIEQTPGALGYLEYGFARRVRLPMARLQNRAGAFVAPGLRAGLAALADAPLPDDLRGWISDPAGADAYPIVTFTWILCRKQASDRRAAHVLQQVLHYCLTEGQQVSAELGYLPLPPNVGVAALEALAQITVEAPD
jgi:phosphate transport system substrate-binding protein